MNLEDPEFIDINSFDMSKTILENSLEELEKYLKYFKDGDYHKFPQPVPK